MDNSTQHLRLQQVRIARWLLAGTLYAPDTLENGLLDHYIAGDIELHQLCKLVDWHQADLWADKWLRG